VQLDCSLRKNDESTGLALQCRIDSSRGRIPMIFITPTTIRQCEFSSGSENRSRILREQTVQCGYYESNKILPYLIAADISALVDIPTR
jgi:hypothetical protein